MTQVEMPTPAWTQLKYHEEQMKLWTTKKRFVAVAAGRGSGKTELAKRRLVRLLNVQKEWEDPRYFYAAPTYAQAKRVAWSHLLRLIPKSWIAETLTSELVIKTVFGSELYVIGLDKPQRIEGVQWDGGVVDESSDVKPGTFALSILPALTWRRGWCWRIGVPKRFGIGAVEFKDFFDAAASGQLDDAEAFAWPSSDILPAEALKYARETMDLKDYDEQFNASWLTAAGGIFYAFDPAYNVRPCGYDPELPILVGSDFNVDPMAWVLCHYRNNHIEVFDEIWLRDSNTPAALDALYGRYQSHRGGWQFYGDATGKARKSSAVSSDYGIISSDGRFINAGRTLHYLKANPPQADKFAAGNAMICNGAGQRRLFIDPRCKHLIHDLKNRTWKPGSREAADEGDMGHISDALCYLLFKLFPIRVLLEDLGSQVISSTTRG